MKNTVKKSPLNDYKKKTPRGKRGLAALGVVLVLTPVLFFIGKNVLPKREPVPMPNIGDIFIYGHYEQDNNLSNGAEPIEWIVLDTDAAHNRVLLISRLGLDTCIFHDGMEYPTWKNSDVRAWLNGEFMNAAFTPKEQKGIAKVTVSMAHDYRGGGVSGGADTKDKIWLLSGEEANLYFPENEDRKAALTAYAAANGAKPNDGGPCWWWLRSPGYYDDTAAIVLDNGMILSFAVYSPFDVVRPAMWVDLSAAPINN